VPQVALFYLGGCFSPKVLPLVRFLISIFLVSIFRTVFPGNVSKFRAFPLPLVRLYYAQAVNSLLESVSSFTFRLPVYLCAACTCGQAISTALLREDRRSLTEAPPVGELACREDFASQEFESADERRATRQMDALKREWMGREQVKKAGG
jgi:hypothetical protein